MGRFIDKGPGALAKSNLINGLIQDGNGLMWIGTDHGGMNLLSKKDFSMRYLVANEDDLKSIGQKQYHQVCTKMPSGTARCTSKKVE